jgi:hypothetical protein
MDPTGNDDDFWKKFNEEQKKFWDSKGSSSIFAYDSDVADKKNNNLWTYLTRILCDSETTYRDLTEQEAKDNGWLRGAEYYAERHQMKVTTYENGYVQEEIVLRHISDYLALIPIGQEFSATTKIESMIIEDSISSVETSVLKEGYSLSPMKNANDPGLSKFIAELEKNGIKVLGKNERIMPNSGLQNAVGEIDVITENAVIQYKNGTPSAGSIITQQIERTIPYVNKPVITFINGKVKDSAINSIINKVEYNNLLVTNDIKTLINVIK